MTDTLVEYFKKRKVLDLGFVEFMTSKHAQTKPYKLFSVNNQDYMVSHFFDSSNNVGFSLIKTNEILNTNKTDMMAFAAVEGDDIICLNTDDNSVWLWCLQTNNGKFVKITTSFEKFKSIAIRGTKE